MRLLFVAAVLACFPCWGGNPPALDRTITTSDGVALHVRTAGSGPACLYVHGGPGQGSRSFELMGGRAFERIASMIYLDQRGSGASANSEDYHLPRMVQDFDEVRRALGVEKICLIAHSFGGILATEYARKYPQHVSAIVMLNAATHYHSPYNTRMRIAFANRLTGHRTTVPQDAGEGELATLEQAALGRLVKQGLGYRLLSEDPATQARMQEIDEGAPRTLDFGTKVLRQKADYPEYYVDHSPATAQVSAPVLVLTGDRDYAVGPEQYRTFRFPDQKTVHLDAGHLMYYERTDEVVREIGTFLAEARVRGTCCNDRR